MPRVTSMSRRRAPSTERTVVPHSTHASQGRFTGLALLLVVTGTFNSACIFDAQLDSGPCYPGRTRVNGQCQEDPSIQPLQAPQMRTAPLPQTDRTLVCQLQLRAEVIDFSHVALHGRARAFVVVSNHGQRSCAVEHAYFSINARGMFALSFGTQTRLVVEPRSFEQFEVYFSPTSIGAQEGKVIVWGEGRVLGSVLLHGMGVEPGSTLQITPPSVDFGVRGMNCGVPGLREVYLHNPTNRVLNARYELNSPGFFSARSGQTIEIGPAATATISVGFVPRVPDQHLGQLRIDVAGTAVNPVYLFGEGGPNSQNVEAFSGASEVRLRGRPVADSVQVFVDGVLMPAVSNGRQNWTLEMVARRIRFVGSAPGADAAVRVHYAQHCAPDTCGNGQLDPGEFCDDGNNNNRDACLSSCESATCGDGSTHFEVEDCDDANTLNGDGCSSTCRLEFCGDGVIEAPEQCDDGALNSDTLPDGCRSDCRFATCSDGVVDDGEYCDDGNSDPNDSCVYCRWARCGDGAVLTGVEECDDGNRLNYDICKNDCSYQSYDFGSEDAPAPQPVDSLVVTSSVVPLPFPFRFLGEPVATLDLTQPGLLGFGATQNLGPDNRPIPESPGPNRFIALWWDALQTTHPAGTPDASVSQTLLGQAPNREYLLHFQNLGFDGAQLNIEVRILEATGRVNVYYAPLQTDPDDHETASASVGWESADGLRGRDVLRCSPSCTLNDWPGGRLLHYSP